MATKKLSALALIAGAAISAADIVPLVDMDSGTPTTYKATAAQLRSSLFKAGGVGWDPADYLQLGGGPVIGTGILRVAQGTLSVDTPLINSTATWNAGTTLMRHVLVNVTDVASNVNSQLVDLQIAGVSQWRVSKGGAVVQTGNLTVGGVTTLQGVFATGATLSSTLTLAPSLGLTFTSNDAGLWIGAASTLYLGDYAVPSKGLRVNFATGAISTTHGLTASGNITALAASVIGGSAGFGQIGMGFDDGSSLYLKTLDSNRNLKIQANGSGTVVLDDVVTVTGALNANGGMVVAGTVGISSTALTISGAGFCQLSSDTVNLYGGRNKLGDAVAAGLTTSTSGYAYITTCAGAPTGVPSVTTGYCAMQYDTTNNKWWIYNGAWRGVVLT